MSLGYSRRYTGRMHEEHRPLKHFEPSSCNEDSMGIGDNYTVFASVSAASHTKPLVSAKPSYRQHQRPLARIVLYIGMKSRLKR